MTTVTFYCDENSKYYGFEADGHSGFARSGHDIVCSSISFMLINLCNSVEKFTDAKGEPLVNEKKGYLKLILTDYDSEKVQLLFESAVLGLSGLQEEYPKYLKLTNRRCKP